MAPSSSKQNKHPKKYAGHKFGGPKKYGGQKFKRTPLRKDKRKYSRSQPDNVEIQQQFGVFKRAFERGENSPDGGDKTTVAEWSDKRGAAAILEKKAIVIDDKEDMRAVIHMKDRYGFKGWLVLDRDGPFYDDLNSEAVSKGFRVIEF